MSPTSVTVSEESGWVNKLVPAVQIFADPALQVRGGLDEAQVVALLAIIQEQEYVDSLRLIACGDQLLLADGFHRLEGYRRAGVTEIRCKVRAGTRADALKIALRENGRHGMPMTSAQKRAAAGMAVADPTVGLMTDKEIARLIGCSTSLISLVRRGESPQTTAAKRERNKAASSPAPAAKTQADTFPVTVRERKPAGPVAHTKAQILSDIDAKLVKEVIDEADLLKLMETSGAEYKQVPRAGGYVGLKIVGPNGRAQIETQVIVKQIGMDGIVLKLENGKLTLLEAQL